MRVRARITVSFLGLLLAVSACARPQKNGFGGALPAPAPNALPPQAVVDQIQFEGLRRIPIQTAKAQIAFRAGEPFDAERITADVQALYRTGWFEDITVEAVEMQRPLNPAASGTPHFRLVFHARERPILAEVEYTGSKVLSRQQIQKLVEEQKLLPPVGEPADRVRLHRAAAAIRAELVASGHPDGRVLLAEETLPGQRVKVEFQIQDGPYLPVLAVHFSGDPQLPGPLLQKQMHDIAPGAWFPGLRNKNVFTPQKAEEDRISLEAYLQNHGFAQARVGTPQTSLVNISSSRYFPWPHRRKEPGLSVDVPVEAGTLYNFGPLELSASLKEKLGAEKKHDSMLTNAAPGRPFSQQAVQSLQRNLELKLRRSQKKSKGHGDYRLQAVSAFDNATRVASVRFAFDPVSPYTVRRIEFQGNRRFPDRYLRRRIGLEEGHPLDEYELEAGLARIAQTGYFQPFKKADVQIETYDPAHTADVTIHIHEKGKQRATFSGGREQFGSTLGIAYTVFNLLGLDEFLSTQFDGGPQALQLAMSLAKEGAFGSRGALALSVFDTFIRPRFAGGVQAPFQRTQTVGVNASWTYAASDLDALGINFAISRSVTEFLKNQPASNGGAQTGNLRSETSSHSLGIGWTHFDGTQKLQLAGSASGGWLGGQENLVRSQAEYGHLFTDEIFSSHNAWAFRTTFRAAGSYKGDMPFYTLFFSGDDLIRGLRPGEFGPYQILSTASSSGATAYSAAPAGANLVAASNLEYRFPLRHGVEGATFFDTGSGLLLPNWLGHTRPTLIGSTDGVIHGTTGLELRWTLPAVGVPVRVNYSFNVLRLNRALLMPDKSIFRVHDRFGVLGWGIGQLF